MDEPDETFLVNLSNPSNAFIEDREGVGRSWTTTERRPSTSPA